MKNFIMIILMIFVGAACSSIPKIPEPPKALVEYSPPKWVLLGGGAWEDSKGKAFYGVGSATGIKNYSLQRTVADDRARGDLGKVFEVYMTSLTKDVIGRCFNKARRISPSVIVPNNLLLLSTTSATLNPP